MWAKAGIIVTSYTFGALVKRIDGGASLPNQSQTQQLGLIRSKKPVVFPFLKPPEEHRPNLAR